MSKDKIINDLARTKPKGPKGTKIHYDVKEGYDYDLHRYRKTYISNIDNYGYTDDQLFQLGFGSKGDVTDYLRTRDFEGASNRVLGRRRATLTRRTNKIWEKIEPSMDRVLSEGRSGIYKVTCVYSTHRDFGHIYAESLKEAQQNADMFYGYLVPRGRVRANFIKIGCVEELTSFNEQCKKGIEKAITRVNHTIESQLEALESLNSRLSTIKIVEQQQIAVEMMQSIEAAADAKESEKGK